MMRMTCSGRALAKRSKASRSTRVAVGLLGSTTTTILVRAVTAASIASRSCTPSRSGTSTGIPPKIVVSIA